MAPDAGMVRLTLEQARAIQFEARHSLGVYTGHFCVACGNWYTDGCKPDCWFAAAIRKAENGEIAQP